MNPNDVYLAPQAFANPADVKLTIQGGATANKVIQLLTLSSMTGD